MLFTNIIKFHFSEDPTNTPSQRTEPQRGAEVTHR